MRLPWHISLSSADNTELEALQTDVMRFVAIIGLCLAAIFSLVNSASTEIQNRQEPQQITASKADPRPEPASVVAPAIHVPEHPANEDEPAPIAAAVVAPVFHATEQPARKTAPAPVAAAAESTTPAPDPGSPGFSLSFASAHALNRLLDSQRVVFYAFADKRSWKFNAESAQFEPGPPPQNYYAMDEQTIPDDLQQRFSAGINPATMSWGVTLPESTVSQLEQLLQGETGELLIEADGGVRLNR